ncbi:unknown [Clostridium sp. CAG:1219]|nr:unknown [Clostridium sp. CAG:1219]
MKVVITEKRLRIFSAIIILVLSVVAVCTYLEVINISRQSEKLECFEGYVAASLTDENVEYNDLSLIANSKEFFLVIDKNKEIKISGKAADVVEKVYDENFGVSDVVSELYGKRVFIEDDELKMF